jgi:hypothetical protein
MDKLPTAAFHVARPSVFERLEKRFRSFEPLTTSESRMLLTSGSAQVVDGLHARLLTMPLSPVMTMYIISFVDSRSKRLEAKVTEMVVHSPGKQVEEPTFLVLNEFSEGILDLRISKWYSAV